MERRSERQERERGIVSDNEGGQMVLSKQQQRQPLAGRTNDLTIQVAEGCRGGGGGVNGKEMAGGGGDR